MYVGKDTAVVVDVTAPAVVVVAPCAGAAVAATTSAIVDVMVGANVVDCSSHADCPLLPFVEWPCGHALHRVAPL